MKSLYETLTNDNTQLVGQKYELRYVSEVGRFSNGGRADDPEPEKPIWHGKDGPAPSLHWAERDNRDRGDYISPVKCWNAGKLRKLANDLNKIETRLTFQYTKKSNIPDRAPAAVKYIASILLNSDISIFDKNSRTVGELEDLLKSCTNGNQGITITVITYGRYYGVKMCLEVFGIGKIDFDFRLK